MRVQAEQDTFYHDSEGVNTRAGRGDVFDVSDKQGAKLIKLGLASAVEDEQQDGEEQPQVDPKPPSQVVIESGKPQDPPKP